MCMMYCVPINFRVYTNPPDMVMTVMAAVCVILQEKPDWPSAKRLLGDSGFLLKLVALDKDNVSDKVWYCTCHFSTCTCLSLILFATHLVFGKRLN